MYMSNRYFVVKEKSIYIKMKAINSGMSQGSDLGLIQSSSLLLTILASHECPVQVSRILYLNICKNVKNGFKNRE